MLYKHFFDLTRVVSVAVIAQTGSMLGELPSRGINLIRMISRGVSFTSLSSVLFYLMELKLTYFIRFGVEALLSIMCSIECHCWCLCERGMIIRTWEIPIFIKYMRPMGLRQSSLNIRSRAKILYRNIWIVLNLWRVVEIRLRLIQIQPCSWSSVGLHLSNLLRRLVDLILRSLSSSIGCLHNFLLCLLIISFTHFIINKI